MLAKFVYMSKIPFESKYQLLINKREKVGIKLTKNQNIFIDYSQAIDDVYENLEGLNKQKIQRHLLIIHKRLMMCMKIYIPKKKRKLLIVFENMMADIEANKRLKPIIS